MAEQPVQLEQALREERQAILAAEGADRPLSALCISGGGIRSATFALGALQSLAKHGILAQFDYLSTVSGGGYIGSWLSAWTTRAGEIGKIVPHLVSDAPPPPNGEPDPVQHLRDYNNYLTPKLGGLSADTWTVVATVVRNIALNWLVLIPLLVAFLMAPRILLAVARLSEYYSEVFGSADAIANSWVVDYALPGVMTALLCMALYNIWRYLPGVGGVNHHSGQYFRFILLPLVGATLLFCAYDTLYLWDNRKLDVSVYMVMTLVPTGLTWIVYLLFCGKPWKKRLSLFWRLSLSIILLSVCLGSSEWLITSRFAPDMGWAAYVTTVPPLMGLSFYAALAIFAGISSTFLEDKDREWMSRASSGVLLASVIWLCGCMLVLLAPKWIFTWKSWSGGVISVLGAASGWMTARSRSTASKSGPAWGAIVMKVAPMVFVVALGLAVAVGTNVLLYQFDAAAVPRCTHDGYATMPAPIAGPYASNPAGIVPWTDHDVFLEHCSWQVLTLVMLGFLTAALLAGRFININKFSLHAMYRDRLIRAYLGASNPARYTRSKSAEKGPNLFTGFAQSDNLPMHELTHRPFHVVNVCLNLVAGERLAWQQRKAESFTFTPLHCGSARLGYRPSQGYAKGSSKAISLGTAITISGAAASPNMGYHSTPVTGFIMTLLNARLGAWFGNPGRAGAHTWTHEGPHWAVASLLCEAFGLTNDRSRYVYLSDGGHFENLALYEMVRRRCRTIVVLDGGCDESLTYEDLGNALRKIRIDLNTSITFRDECMVPLRDRKKRCAVADIVYPDGQRGELVYVKPLMLNDEPPDVASYSKANPAFPHQSTGDQWFDESQTESYRMLGEFTMDSVCGGWKPEGPLAEFAKHVTRKYLMAAEAEEAAAAEA